MTKTKETPKALILPPGHPPIKVIEKEASIKPTRTRTRRPPPPWKVEEEREVAELGREEGKLSLEDAINNNYANLKNFFNLYQDYQRLKKLLDQWRPNGSFDDFKQWITGQIDDGKINRFTIDDWLDAYKYKTTPDSDIGALRCSCTFTILAERALVHEERDRGWAFVAEAYYLAGFAESVFLCESLKNEAEKLHEIRSKGGKGKTENYKPARNELLELLTRPPEGGWIDIPAAKKDIEPLLDEFETKRMKNPETATAARLSKSNLKFLLTDWFKEDEILAAYHANSKETRSKSSLPTSE